MTDDSKLKGCRRVLHVFMLREPPRPTAAWPAMTDKRREANSSFWIWAKRNEEVRVPGNRADDNPRAFRARER